MTRPLRPILALVGLLAACPDTPEEAAAPTPDLASRVTWAQPAPVERYTLATLPGVVEARVGSAQQLALTQDARIVAWRVEPGQAVAAGDVLAELASPALSALDGRLTALRQAADARVRALEGAEAARAAGVADRATVQAAAAAAAEAEAEVRTVAEELAAQRGSTRRTGATWAWTAPRAGTVAEVHCGLDMLAAGTVCVSLVEPGAVRLRVDVPERYLDRLDTTLQAAFVSADGRSWSFTEAARAPEVDPGHRARSVWLDPTADAPLPGVSGRVDLTVPAPQDARRIPPAALSRLGGAPVVYVQEGERGLARPVELLGRAEGDPVVRGLDDDPQVAVRGVFLLASLAALEEAP